jgi:hypothetical protein
MCRLSQHLKLEAPRKYWQIKDSKQMAGIKVHLIESKILRAQWTSSQALRSEIPKVQNSDRTLKMVYQDNALYKGKRKT